jgi:hypothetical protein
MQWLKTWILEVLVVGGIYSPNHQSGRWGRLLTYGAQDSPVRHRTLLSHPDFRGPKLGREHNHQVCWDQVSHV